jgi:hypothetical protein
MKKSAEIPVEMADVSSSTHCPQITQGGDDLDSDQDASYDENSDGVSTRRKCRYQIFNSCAETPLLCFRGRDQLKDAIERYTLKMKVNVRYVKNDKERIRLYVGGKVVPGFCMLHITLRSDWFQIVTYDPNHACCPELKNKRSSTSRICGKYESTVKANPSWKARALKEKVQEGISVDVSITMIKRVKAKVMKTIMDSQSGEYSKLFDYALELNRSNPGTSEHIALDPEEEDHVFLRIYICFDACRRGFLDGCRRVPGLGGCFLKGTLKCELLSAVGRDTNIQVTQ